MIKYCKNTKCTHRLCPNHIYNKPEDLNCKLHDLIYSNVCRLASKPKPKKRPRDVEPSPLKFEFPNRVWTTKKLI